MHDASRDVTVLVSSSSIESHPSPAIIEETIASVLYHLPDSSILVMLDGVREEQKDRLGDYEEYIRRLAHSKLAPHFTTIYFKTFMHQAGMTLQSLNWVSNPLILFVEHDTPLVERPIDWEMLKQEIGLGHTNHIRLHYDERIHPEHEHLMCGKLSPLLIKTRQWHQRPHLASRPWYGMMLASVFGPTSRTFIEDRIYTFVENAPWEQYKLTIYDPDGNGQRMKRSRDLNGRGSEQKYSMTF